MNKLQVFTYGNVDVLDSRLVAEMVEKEHKNLLADIRGYIGHMANELKIQPVDFFIESTYLDSKGEPRPCYLVTRKGCEFIANKLTGKKGTLFTAAYINAFHAHERALKELSGHVKDDAPLSEDTKRLLAEAKLNNSRARVSSVWLKIGQMLNEPAHKQLCASYASRELSGAPVIPAPTVEKTYSATELGEMFGVSSQKIGSIANQNGLKTSAYGMLVLDKSRYSSKEVQAFRYNQKAVAWFKNYFCREGV